MTSAAMSRARSNPVPSALPADNLTHVELTHIEKRIENWIRFGHEAHERVLDRRRRVFSYRSGSVFAFVCWASNDFGTITSNIHVVRAIDPGESYQTLRHVRPGGDILLHIAGWPRVEQVLRHIDTLEAAGLDACEVAPDHWRHVGNRIGAGHEPRPYTLERHRAWLKRREVEQ